MVTYARKVNDTAVDVTTTDPATIFFHTIADEFIVVPDEVQNGWVFKGGIWSENITPESEIVSPAITPPTVSVIKFLLLFTSAERVAIKASVDPVVQDLWLLISDPRLTYVDLSLPSVNDALGYLAEVGCIKKERIAEILAGQVV